MEPTDPVFSNLASFQMVKLQGCIDQNNKFNNPPETNNFPGKSARSGRKHFLNFQFVAKMMGS